MKGIKGNEGSCVCVEKGMDSTFVQVNNNPGRWTSLEFQSLSLSFMEGKRGTRKEPGKGDDAEGGKIIRVLTASG